MLIVLIANLFTSHLVIKSTITVLIIVTYTILCFIYWPFKMKKMNILSLFASSI